MVGIPANHPIRRDLRFNNSVNENALLRIRNLCDFSTSTHSNDIKPEDLFDNYAMDLKYKRLNQLVAWTRSMGRAAKEVCDGHSTKSSRIRQR